MVLLGDARFICSKLDFAHWASGRKQLRMEYFYRDMRRKTGLLMQDGEPVCAQWNFDSDNREAYRGDPPIPARHTFQRDEIDQQVLELVERCFSSHPGSLTKFNWPTSRQQALFALDAFVEHQLPWFGDYQDAMQQSQHFMFHSLLSTSLNCGLLTAMEVCLAAENAWREYIRGIYWLKMPEYAQHNALGNTRKLPQYYWSGVTGMACMSDCIQNTFENAYAHHIQRLMVTGTLSTAMPISFSATRA